MKRRIICFVLTMAMVLSMLVIVPAVTASAASNTYNASDNPVLITTRADLKDFRNAVNGGNTFEGKVVKLCGDIDISDAAWTPIAKNGYAFCGSFDGQGHTITGLYQSYGRFTGDGGLFGFVQVPTTGGTIYIKNLFLTKKGSEKMNSSNGGYCAGTLVSIVAPRSGYAGTVNIENIYSSVDFDSSGSLMTAFGGIVGTISGTTSQRDNNVEYASGTSITLNIDSCQYAGLAGSPTAGSTWYGGIFGCNNFVRCNQTVSITNCLVTGELHIWGSGGITNYDDNGGIMGYVKGNGGASGCKTTISLCNNVFAGKILWRRDSNQTGGTSDQGFILGEITSGFLNGKVTMTNNYYVVSTPEGGLNVTAGLGAGSGNATITNLTEKTLAQIKALTSGFSDNSKWNFVNTSTTPIPVSIYNLSPLGVSAGILGQTSFTISTADQLVQLAKAVNGYFSFSGATITLGADIDLTDYDWPTIGTRRDGNGSAAFKGTFDGANHIVKLASLTGSQSEGGLFGYTQGATIRNLYLTGTIDFDKTKSDVSVGYFGSVIGCVGSGTTTVSNVLSDVRIYTNAKWFQYSGGFIGGIDNNVNATLTCTDCVYAGRIYSNASVQESGGFFGYTGNITSSYTKTLTFTRCAFTGLFSTDTNSTGYYEDNAAFLGYCKNNGDNPGKLVVNMTDCMVTGKMTFGEKAAELDLSAEAACVIGWAGVQHAETAYNATNVYYVPFNLPSGTAAAAKRGSGNPTLTSKTASEMGGLTSSNFSGGSTYWSFSSGYIPCPKAIVTAFGWTSTFEVPAITIATKDAFLAFRDAVNGGKSYSGEVLKLTADIDLTGESWQEIGRAAGTSSAGSNVFRGTFNGDGHTISNMTTVLEPTTDYVDMQGGLFGNLGDGAVVKNFTLTGSMTIRNYYDGSGTSAYFGSIANAVSGTVKIENVYSSVNITASNNVNPTSGNWGGGTSYIAGLVGFALHGSTTTLTIDGCEYAGTINCGNRAVGTAGIMASTGNGGTKVFNITNTVFSGRVTLNDNSGAYAYTDCGGIFGRLASGTLNISNTHAGGDHFYFNRSRAWSATNISAGQIIGQVVSGATANIAESVSYSPIVLYTEVSGGSPVESSKFVLGEIGYDGNTSTYSKDTPAHTDGFGSDAEARNVNDDYKGIRFSGTIFNTSSCTGGGTQAANFGVFLMTKDIYDLFRGNLTYANLNAAATALENVVKVMGLKYKDNGESYTVYAVVYNLNTSARKATELVAVPYLGTRIGEATVATYNSVFG